MISFFNQSAVFAVIEINNWNLNSLITPAVFMLVSFSLLLVLSIFFIVYLRLKRQMNSLNGSILKDGENQNKFETIFEKSPNAIVIHDGNKTLECNEAAVKMIGAKNKDEIIGVHPAIFSPDYQPDGRNSVEAGKEEDAIALRKGFHRFDWTHKKLDTGKIFRVEVALTIMSMNGTEVFLTIWTDLSERNKAQEDIKKFFTAVEQSPISVMITDLDGKIDYVNPQFTILTGFTFDELRGKKPKALKSGHHTATFYQDLWETIDGGNTWEGEFCNKKKNGDLYWEAAKINSIRNASGEIIQYMAIKEDITEKKLSEEKLLKTKDEIILLNQLVTGSLAAANIGAWWIDTDEEDTFHALGKAATMLGIPVNEAEDKSYSLTKWMGVLQKTGEAYPEHQYYINDTFEQFQAYLTGELDKGEGTYPIIQPDGTLRWFIARAEVVQRKEDGSAKIITGTLIDFTELKKTEDEFMLSNERLNLGIDIAGLGIWDWDIKKNTTSWNDKLFEIYGLPIEVPMPYEKWLAAVHPEDVEEAEEFLGQVFATKSKGFGEFRIVRPDNTIRYISAVSTPVLNSDGNIIRQMGINIDVTERANYEIQLTKAKEIAEDAAKMKGSFLANMSHEIRTPMNAIMGLTELLSHSELSSKQYDYVEKIGRSSKNLLGIINDILDFSKIEAGKMNIESIRFNIDDVIRNLSSVLSVKAFQKGLELTFIRDSKAPMWYMGDPLRINQILMNLCNNSIKFTEEGEVGLRINMTKVEDNNYNMQLVVEDTGIGMTQSQVSGLFKSFSQADGSITRKYGGTGLGLTITKTLTELMGGTIHVESEYGKGSRFIVDIPLICEDERSSSDYFAPDYVSELNVAVVDDSEASREIYDMYLEFMSKQPTLFKSGEEFLLSKRHDFDIVIMDFNLPGISGVETWAEYSKEESDNETKIMVVTAYGKEDVLEEIAAAGIEYVLSKPLTPSDLYNGIINLMENRHDVSNVQNRTVDEVLMAFEPIRVLLVEDNMINQQVVLENLEAYPFEITAVDNGSLAVDEIRNTRANYDIVLMDLHMPVMDGYEATSRIRELHSEQTLPIIALTADVMSETRQRIRETGMNAHVGKPINIRELLETIKELLPHKNIADRGTSENQMDQIHFDELTSFNTSEAIERLSGNQIFYLKLLKRFKTRYSGFGEDLDKIKKSSDVEEVIRYFHTLKGLSGSTGNQTLYILSSEIEKEMIEDSETVLNQWADKIARISDVMSDSIEQLSDFINRLPKDHFDESNQITVDTDIDIEKELKILKEFLDGYNTQSINQLKKIKDYLIELSSNETYSSIYKLIDDHDYEAALAKIEQISKD